MGPVGESEENPGEIARETPRKSEEYYRVCGCNGNGDPHFCSKSCFFAPGCLGNAALEVPFLTKQVFIFSKKQSPCHPPARALNILAQEHLLSDSSCT